MESKWSWVRAALVLVAVAFLIDRSVDAGRMKDLFVGRKTDNKAERLEEKPVKEQVEKQVETEVVSVERKPFELFQYKSNPEDIYSIEQLNVAIGYSLAQIVPATLVSHGSSEYVWSPPQYPRLVDILAATENKDKPNTVLGQFSVNELLKWATYHPDDCKLDQIDAREKKCDELNPDWVAAPADPEVQRALRSNRYYASMGLLPQEWMRRFNVYVYCRESKTLLRNACLKDKFNPMFDKDQPKLNQFKGLIMQKYRSDSKLTFDYHILIPKVFAEMAPSDVEEIKTICGELVKTLRSYYNEDAFFHPGNLNYFGMCEKAVN